MKAIILAAGQGRRLLPWTKDLPKCLLPFAGRSLLSWQLAALADNDVEETVVVTGFLADEVEREICRVAPPRMDVIAVHNPFYGIAENIVSCWVARDHLHGEVAVINGDTLFEPKVLARVREGAKYPVNITVDVKAAYDADDMKVQLDADQVMRIGKTLSAEQSDAESIGLLYLRGLGAPLFANAVETLVRQPGGVSRWYLSAVDDLAARQVVGVVSIAGLGWTEVDYPADLPRAEMLAGRWAGTMAPHGNRVAQ